MIDLSHSRLGAHNELVATIWLLKRGYHAFRNVAPVGPIDLVGIKDGLTELFDVKTGHRGADGRLIHPKLSEEQLAMGVQCICVLPDGSCELSIQALDVGHCKQCGAPFEQGKRWSRRRFCSPRCGKAAKRSGSTEGGLLG